jgi:phosphoglycerate dehydrogenase-like enzyme
MDRRTFLTTAAAAAISTAPLLSARASAASVARTGKLKVLVPVMPPAQLEDLTKAASGIELIACRSQDEAIARVPDADASYGFITEDLIKAGKSLKWVQQASAGVEQLMEIPELVNSNIVLTNMQRAYAPEIADQAMGYLLAFTRKLRQFILDQSKQQWSKVPDTVPLDELPGKTILVIGMGGIGSEIAQRAAAFGMRVLATDPKVLVPPPSVAELHRPDALKSLLPRADVVASAAPLTKVTRKMLGAEEFALMKPGVIFINVSRGGIVDTNALVAALDSGHVAAAGLDVTDPEPLPRGHDLWTRNVIITPHDAGQSVGVARRRHEVTRENLRRFQAGEMLLNIVDKKVGY